jgi:hypothetical protein
VRVKIGELLLVFACLAHAEMLIAAKLCDMVERPDQFKNKLVSFRAEAVVEFVTASRLALSSR